mmetsp:Transcript_57325/g.153524  ORF Transcript_57325/g.153524 Transcript_57325/m.153524 type:complete len:355 (-) Transcript_57325:138-1202(-)
MALVVQDALAKAGTDLESQDDQVLCTALMVIARAGESGESYFSKAFELAKNSGGLAVKRAAMEAVAATCKGQAAKATPVLEEGLGNSDAVVRKASAYGLGVLKSEGSVSKLSPLVTDSHMLVRNAAMAALGAIGPKAGSEVGNIVTNLRAPLLRADAIHALGKLGKDGAAQADQIAIYLEDSDPSVRLAVGEALRNMGDAVPDNIVEKAADILEHQSDRFRATAALALASCGAKALQHKATLVRMLRENVINFNQPMLTPNCAAAIALGRLGVEGERLVGYLKSKNGCMRAAVCQAISEMGKAGISHAAAVADCLKDEDTGVRTAAFSALEALQKVGSLDSAATAALEAFKKGD